MWKKFACAETFEDLKNKEIDQKSYSIITKIMDNKYIYYALRTVMNVIGAITGIAVSGVHIGYTLLHIVNPNLKLSTKNTNIYNFFMASTRITNAFTINFIELDMKIKNINPNSNFIRNIGNLSFTTNFAQFEKDCDDIFSNETISYAAEDFISLLCVVYDVLMGKKSARLENMSFIKKISPYSLKELPKNMISDKISITKELFDKSHDYPSIDMFEEKGQYFMNVPQGDIPITPEMPMELVTALRQTKSLFTDRTLNPTLDKMFYKNDAIMKEDKLETAWSDTGADEILKNHKLTAAEASFLKSALLSPYMEMGGGILTENNSVQYNYIKDHYNNYMLSLQDTRSIEFMKRRNDIERDTHKLMPLKAELATFLNGGAAPGARDDVAITALINPIEDNIKEAKRNMDALLLTAKKDFNINLANIDKSLTIGNITLDNNKIHDTDEIKKLIEYYDTIIETHVPADNFAWKRDLHSSMQYEDSMKYAYDKYYKEEHTKFTKNVGFAVLLGGIWAIYPTTKIILQVLGEKIRNTILKPDTINKINDEIIGLMAGVLLGPKYLSQFTVIKSKVGTEIAKDMVTPRTDNELITDIISGVKTEENKYTQYSKAPKDDVEFNVLMNRKDVDNVKMKYEKMKQLAEYEKKAKDVKKIKDDYAQEVKKTYGSPEEKKTPVGKIDEKKLLTTLIEQEDTLSKKSDKFIDKLDKDSFAKGVQVGMIVNTSYDIKVNKNKRKIHKALCSMSLHSRNIGEIVSKSITTMMALTYIFKKLATVSVGHYIQYIGKSPLNIDDLCKFASPHARVTKPKSTPIRNLPFI